MRKPARFFALAILALCSVLYPTQGAYAQPFVYALSPGGTMPGSEILKLTSAGRHEEARAKATQRIAEQHEDIDAYVGLAWSLVALKRYAEAETWASRGYAIRKDPRLAQAIGEASYYLGKNETALEMLKEYIASYPEGQRAGLSFFLCGELYIRSARYMHADIAFSAAVRHNPGNPAWWARLGWARENCKKYFQALAAYESALSLNPNLADAVEGKRRIQERTRE
ncbi:MAG TPA: tetratricopeptide repeat protein [Rectinemataceae bacterium]